MGKSYLEETVYDDVTGRNYTLRKKLDPLTELESIKHFREREYRDRWLREHRCDYDSDAAALLHCHAPTDADINWPPQQTMLVEWETGFIVVDLEQLSKLPKRQQNKIYKLGGMNP